MGSVEQVPYGIRWLCRQIRTLMKEKFPDAGEERTTSLIGGFFLLRFVNPAIVTPQAYMLIHDKPSNNARKTLTLVAKLLQNLANKPNLQKEPHMKAFEVFNQRNAKPFSDFLNALCECEDFWESLEMDQYVALSRTDINIQITLNEIFNVHELLKRHVSELAPAEDDQLKVILNDLGPAPAQMPRSENRSTQLQLFSRFEQEAADLSASNTGNLRILYSNVRNSLVSLARWMGSSGDGGYAKLLDAAKASDQPNVNGIGAQVAASLERLGAASFDLAGLDEHLKQDLASLSLQLEKVNKELGSLNKVYENICLHNNYLLSQLDTYKVYLLNVRGQASAGTTTLQVQKQKESGTTKSKKSKKGKVREGGAQGPFKFGHVMLEKDGVIIESDVPENRRNNIYFNFNSPVPGTFLIALHYKGRDKAILEMNLKLDDLLEKQQDNIQTLDLEYVQLNVNKTLHLLNKTFSSNKGGSSKS